MRASKNARFILNKAYYRHIYTELELSERMGWSLPTTTKRLKNPMVMSVGDAVKLCKLVGMTMDELISLK